MAPGPAIKRVVTSGAELPVATDTNSPSVALVSLAQTGFTQISFAEAASNTLHANGWANYKLWSELPQIPVRALGRPDTPTIAAPVAALHKALGGPSFAALVFLIHRPQETP